MAEKTAIFTNEDGKVTLFHYRPEKLSKEKRKKAALIVDEKVKRPTEAPDDKSLETHRPVAKVKDGELVWEWVERPDKSDKSDK